MTLEDIAHDLAAALRQMPCACQYGPEWRNVATSVVEMKPIKTCVKHSALFEYDLYLTLVKGD